MKKFLKKLHIMSNQSEDGEGSGSFQGGGLSQSSPSREHKAFPGLSNWLNSISNRGNPSSTSSSIVKGRRQIDSSHSVGVAPVDTGGLEAVRGASESVGSKDPEIDEEYQIQVAMELSAKEDPEAVQIEAVKQISLGSSLLYSTPAEVVAYRYWVSSSHYKNLCSSFSLILLIIWGIFFLCKFYMKSMKGTLLSCCLEYIPVTV